MTPYCRHLPSASCTFCETEAPDRPAYIFGNGAHGALIRELLGDCGRPFLGWLDDSEGGRRPEEVPVGPCYIGVGNPFARERVAQRLYARGFTPGHALVHPTAYVSSTARLGGGTVVFPHATVNANVKVGEHAIVHCNAIVHHDTELADFVSIGPGANVCGRCSIGKSTLVGPSSMVLLRKTVGEAALIGAGATVVTNVETMSLMLGVPAKHQRFINEEDWKGFF